MSEATLLLAPAHMALSAACVRQQQRGVAELRLLAARLFNDVRGKNRLCSVALDDAPVRAAAAAYRAAFAAAAALLDTLEELHGVVVQVASLRVALPDGEPRARTRDATHRSTIQCDT